MRYTVLWTPKAEQWLAEIWTTAEDREAVTSAASSIDEMLRDKPESRGESRGGPVRILFSPPLAAEYEVSPADRTVYVLAVWTYGKGRRPS